jgi:hypothetical protein
MIISINGQGALTLPEVNRNCSMILMDNFNFDADATKCKTFFSQLEVYFLSLGWDYLNDKSICMKDAKVCPGR